MSRVKVDGLQMATYGLLNWLFQGRSTSLPNESIWQLDIFRQQLQNAPALYPRLPATSSIRLRQFESPKNRGGSPIRQLVSGFEALADYFHTVVIHGSVASQEIVKNWSDMDILCVLKDSVFESAEQVAVVRRHMQKLEKLLYVFDPWQHHGFQFMSEADLRYYPESWLPLEVIRHGKVMVGRRALRFGVRNSDSEKKARVYGWATVFSQSAQTGILTHHARNGVYLKNNFLNAQNSFYQLKYFMSVILLMPSLFIELVDQPIYKKDSFAAIRTYFSDEELELVDACQAGRRLMPKLTIRQNAIPAPLRATIGPNYFERAFTLMERMIQEYEIRQRT